MCSHRRYGWLTCVLVSLTALVTGPTLAQDDSNDLQDLLEQVGEQYAQAYIAPLTSGFGANQNSGLYTSAHIPVAKLTFSVAIKAMGAHLKVEDQTFRRVIEVDNLNDYFDLGPGDPGYDQPGTIVMTGPTVIGDDAQTGTITGYVNNTPVQQIEGIEGLINTRWVPLAAPEVSVGGYMGVRATVRWVPSIDAGDYGKTKYLGYGLQWSPNQYLPGLPVDVMVGFFKQKIDIGTIVKTDAHSIFAAASKDFGPATLYGGLAAEKSTLEVDYTEAGTDTHVNFKTEGQMKSRVTFGASLHFLYAEANFGKMTVFSAGVGFGL